MRTHRILSLLLAAAIACVTLTPAVSDAAPKVATSRWYQHIFVIMLENHADDILVTGHAPHLTALATTYGIATHFYAIRHPSEPNYIALLGGSTFGLTGDAPYNYTSHGVSYTVAKPNLATQLEAAGLSWKSYQQSLPYAGYTGTSYPNADKPLYVSRHNPFMNFASVVHSKKELQQVVPDTQLAKDLKSGQLPTFGFITPDVCHDMHGQWSACPSAHKTGDSRDVRLIGLADTYVWETVQEITHAAFWNQGNNAIVITWDEDDSAVEPKGKNLGVTGCCDALPGGGHIPTIVVTSHGPRKLSDPTPYNHYSLLRTIQVAFGLGCLQHTCDTKQVHIMRQLFTVKS